MALFYAFCDDDANVSFDYPQQYRAFMRGQMRGKEIEIEVREKGRKRSKKQNDALHAMLGPWVAEGHTLDGLKRDLLEAVFGTFEVENAITGQIVTVLAKPHTSQLTVREFCELMERSVEIAAECGVILYLPEEYKQMKREAMKQAAREAKKAQGEAA